MTAFFNRLIARLIADEAGQDLVEYALLSTVIGLCAVAAWSAIQTAIRLTFGSYDTNVNTLWQPADPAGGS